MKWKKLTVLFLILTIVAALLVLRRMPTEAMAQTRLAARDAHLLELIANKRGIPITSLSLLSSKEVNLPLTKQRFTTAKVLHRDRNDVFTFAADANSNEVDPAKLFQAEDAASQATYGKLDPAL